SRSHASVGVIQKYNWIIVHFKHRIVISANNLSEMKYKRYSGVVVPMVTPLHTDFRVDTTAVGRLVRLFAQHHIDPLVLGTTGESPSISVKESKRLLRTAVSARGEGQLIYAGLVGT